MANELAIHTHREGVVIDVYAQPRSSRAEVVGVHDGALRVRITAPPVDGAANEALVTLLSEYFGVRKSAVEVIGGASGRRKRVLVRGLSLTDVLEKIEGG